jgi:hypothetical protein
MEVEVAEFVKKHQNKIDAEGRRQVVPNGYMPVRDPVTGISALMVRQPRLDDRDDRVKSAALFLSLGTALNAVLSRYQQ